MGLDVSLETRLETDKAHIVHLTFLFKQLTTTNMSPTPSVLTPEEKEHFLTHGWIK